MARLTRAGYRRLPGWGPRKTGLFAGFGTRCRLYLAEDHILSVDNHGLSEDYKRFYFTDIQAIVTRKTSRWIVEAAIVLLVAAGMTGCSLLLLSRPLGGFWMGLSIILIIYLVYHLARGPTCACHIVTAVQEDLLPTVNRLRISRKVVPLLRSAVERVQGTVNAEEMAAAPVEDGPRYSGLKRNGARGSEERGMAGRPAGRYRGGAHVAAFCLLFSDGVLTAIDLTTHHMPSLMTLSVFVTAAYCVFIVVALAKQRNRVAFGKTRLVTWASLVFIFVSFCLSYAVMVYAMMLGKLVRPHIMTNQWDMTRAMLRLSPHGSLFLTVVYGFEAICSLGLGGLGLAAILRWRQTGTARAAVDRTGQGMSAP
ncbi:MAG: hypothetical protein ABSH25_15575 [Syntrophorhabdales bacterium]|jgi:hypothetical protein